MGIMVQDMTMAIGGLIHTIILIRDTVMVAEDITAMEEAAYAATHLHRDLTARAAWVEPMTE
jgi:hypothetical protein